MESSDLQKIFDRFIVFLKLLAADYRTQKRTYPDIDALGRELTLHLGEVNLELQNLVDRKLIHQKHLKKIKELDTQIKRIFETMDKGTWDDEDRIRDYYDWNEIREFSFLFLQEFGVGYDEINLDDTGTVYIEDNEKSSPGVTEYFGDYTKPIFPGL